VIHRSGSCIEHTCFTFYRGNEAFFYWQSEGLIDIGETLAHRDLGETIRFLLDQYHARLKFDFEETKWVEDQSII
jgi:hypothetical protein